MAGGLRTRRRRHVAAALRALAPAAALPVQGTRAGSAAGTRVAELAGAARLTLFPGTDCAEALARLDSNQGIPPEVVLAIAAMLLPVLTERGR